MGTFLISLLRYVPACCLGEDGWIALSIGLDSSCDPLSPNSKRSMTSWAAGTANNGYLWTPRTLAGKFMFFFGHVFPRNSSAVAKDRYDSSCQGLPQIPPLLCRLRLVYHATETQAMSSHVVRGRVVSHGKPRCACHTVRPVVPSLPGSRCRSKGFGSSTLTGIKPRVFSSSLPNHWWGKHSVRYY